MADVNGLKKVNDTWGVTGDALLRSAARILLGAFRAEDIVARFGETSSSFFFREPT